MVGRGPPCRTPPNTRTPSKSALALLPRCALHKLKVKFVLEQQVCSGAFFRNLGARETATVSPAHPQPQLPLTPATLHQLTQ